MPLLYTYLGKNVSSINYLQKDQNCFYKSLRFSTAIAALDDLCVRKIIQNSQTSDTPWNLLSGHIFQKKKTPTLKKKKQGFLYTQDACDYKKCWALYERARESRFQHILHAACGYFA